MEFNLNMPNLGEEKLAISDLATIWNLRIGNAVIAPLPFESGETRLFAMLAPSQEGFED
jgi:hypothetical protein